MRTSVARRRTVTPGPEISSRISGAGRELLRRVMAGLRAKHDLTLAEWCRHHGHGVWRVRAALLGGSKAPEGVAGAQGAIRAAGLEEER
jgi:hypothetical protein